MAVNFPQNPSEGDTFTSGNSTFAFTGGKWVSATAPDSLVSKSGDTMTGLLTLSGEPVSDDQAATKLYADTRRMAGEVTMWCGSSAPSGWLECNGQSTSGFTALAAIVGANVPDLRGEFVRGWDNGRGVDTGRPILTAQGDEFESHTHIQDSHNHTQNSHNHIQNPHTHQANYTPLTYVAGYPQANGLVTTPTVLTNISTNTATNIANTATNIANTATNQNTGGTETRPRNISLMYIIKT